jgi:predicted nucleic acid-binding protein
MSAKESLQFVDTNILVYAYDNSTGEKNQRARALVKGLWERKSGCLSVQVLQELHVSLTHKVAYPIDLESASQIIEDLCVWPMHSPGGLDVLGAIRLQGRYQLSFWDAMILHSAIEMGCDLLWSEDFSDGQVMGGVKVANPFAQPDINSTK